MTRAIPETVEQKNIENPRASHLRIICDCQRWAWFFAPPAPHVTPEFDTLKYIDLSARLIQYAGHPPGEFYSLYEGVCSDCGKEYAILSQAWWSDFP